MCGHGFFIPNQRRALGRSAVGGLSGGGAVLLSAHRVLPDLRPAGVVEAHGGGTVSTAKGGAGGRHPAASSVHGLGGHHRHRLGGGGGGGHLLRRSGDSVLDVDVCPAGDDDRVRRENPGHSIPGEGREGSVAGRAHDLHPTGTETAVAGLCVRSAVRGGDSGGGQPGPGQFHRHRAGAVCGTFPESGGRGAGSGGVGGAHGGHPPGVPAQPATGAGDGGDLHRRRGRGDCRQRPEAPPGDGVRGQCFGCGCLPCWG